MSRTERFFDMAAEAAGGCGMACTCAFIAFGLLGIDEIALPCILAALGFGVVCAAGTVLSGQRLRGRARDEYDDPEEDMLWPDEEDIRADAGDDDVDVWEDRYVD